MTCTEANSPQPTDTTPLISSSRSVSSFSVLSARSTISSARRRSSIPSSVNVTLRAPRENSVTPTSSSNCASCRLNVGCVICSSSAAFVIFSSRATARKYLSIRNSIASASFYPGQLHLPVLSFSFYHKVFLCSQASFICP